MLQVGGSGAGLCWEDVGSGFAIQRKPCDGTNVHQFFQYQASGVINTWEGECVDDFDFGLTDSPIQAYACNGGDNQHWSKDPNNEFHGHGGECIEAVTASKYTNPVVLEMEPCNGDINDQKFIQPVLWGTTQYTPFTIRAYAPATPDLVLGVPEGQENTRLAPVQIQNLGRDTATRLAQTWSYDPQTLEIHLSASVGDGAGMCLDVAGGETQDGRSWVTIWPCYGGPSQQWIQASPHQYVNAHSHKCLDVRGSSLNPGDLVWTWSCTGGLNQAWDGPHS
jgi:hypothetical protein